jgi:hypothetical protein
MTVGRFFGDHWEILGRSLGNSWEIIRRFTVERLFGDCWENDCWEKVGRTFRDVGRSPGIPNDLPIIFQ